MGIDKTKFVRLRSGIFYTLNKLAENGHCYGEREQLVKKAKELLAANRDAMDEIAAYLIQKETITGKEFMKIFRELKGIPEPEEEEKKTFFEQAEDAKNALEQAKTEEHAKTEGQTEIKNQAEAETSRAAEDQNTVSLEKGSFIDQVVDDQTAAHEEHQK
mgnify:CR=1 FL=1